MKTTPEVSRDGVAGRPLLESVNLPTASTQRTDRGFSFSDGSEEEEEVLSDTDRATPPSSSTSTDEEGRPRNELLRTWFSWASAAMVGGLLVLFGEQLHRTVSEQEPAPAWIATSEKVAQFSPDAGVAGEVAASVQDVPRARPSTVPRSRTSLRRAA